MRTIADLNDDSLSHVFLCCTSTAAQEMPLVSPHEAPLLLTHVCRGWRTLALATPGLWNRLKITRRSYYSPSGEALPEINRYLWPLRMWLEHAGALPLSVDIDFCWYGQAANAPRYQILEEGSTLLVLKMQSHRIQHLFLKCRTQEFFDKFITAKSPTPLIESLSLQLYGSDRISHKLDLSSYHLLRRLDITGLGLHIELDMPNMRFLRSLTLQCWERGRKPPTPRFTVTYLLEILDRCPVLQEFKAYIYRQGDIVPVNRIYTSLRKVELVIPVAHSPGGASPGTAMQMLIGAIQAPNLEHFVCSNPYDHPAPGSFNIYPVLECSRPPLQSLLLDIHVSEDDILKCLPLLPKLTSFRLHTQTGILGNRFFVGLIPSYICPKLEKLHITSTGELSTDTVRDFIQSRCHHVDAQSDHGDAKAACVHLKLVDLGVSSRHPARRLWDDPSLQPCFAHGLNLHIHIR